MKHLCSSSARNNSRPLAIYDQSHHLANQIFKDLGALYFVYNHLEFECVIQRLGLEQSDWSIGMG